MIGVRASLLGWYERLGYVRTGEVKPFPDDPSVGKPLRGDLSLLTLVKSLRTQA